MAKPKSPNQMPLFAMTDPERGMDPLKLIAKIPRGNTLIFRHYQVKNRNNLAKKILAECRKAKVRCLISHDIRLALKLKADGIHFPEFALKRMGSRPKIHKGMIITAASHSLPMVLRAQKLGLDAVIFSPIFFTKSHPQKAPLGILSLASLCRIAKIPVIALGGIRPKHVPLLKYSGARGIAGIGLFNEIGE